MENIGVVTLLALMLATYRITRLVVSDSVPFGKLRAQKVGTMVGELMGCPYCTSVHVGIGLALGQGLIGGVWAWQVFVGAMALSGVVSLVATYAHESFD